MSESIDRQLSAFRELAKELDGRLDELHDDICDLASRINGVVRRVNELEQRLAKLEKSE